jgi:hypothetical protein
VIWLAATVVASGVLAAVTLIIAQTIPSAALEAGERYAWDGWWLIWLHGAYLTACLLTLSLLVVGTVHGLAGWFGRRRQAKGAA